MKLSKCIWLTTALHICCAEASILNFEMYHLTEKGAIYSGRFQTQGTNDGDIQPTATVSYEPQGKADNEVVDQSIIKRVRSSNSKTYKRIIKSRRVSGRNKRTLSSFNSGSTESDSSYPLSSASATASLTKTCSGSESSIAFSGSLASVTVMIEENAGPIFGILKFNGKISRLIKGSEDDDFFKDIIRSAREQAERDYSMLANQLIISDGTAIFDKIWGSNCQWEYITYYDPESQLVHWELIDPDGQHFMLIQQEPIYSSEILDLSQLGAHTVSQVVSEHIYDELSGPVTDSVVDPTLASLGSGGLMDESVENTGYGSTQVQSGSSQASLSSSLPNQPSMSMSSVQQAGIDSTQKNSHAPSSWSLNFSNAAKLLTSGRLFSSKASKKKESAKSSKSLPLEGGQQAEVVFVSGETESPHYGVSRVNSASGNGNNHVNSHSPSTEGRGLLDDTVCLAMKPGVREESDVMVCINISELQRRFVQNEGSKHHDDGSDEDKINHSTPPVACRDGKPKQRDRRPDDDHDGPGGSYKGYRDPPLQENPSYGDSETVMAGQGSGSSPKGKKHGAGESVSEAVPAVLIWPVFLMAPVQYMKAGRVY